MRKKLSVIVLLCAVLALGIISTASAADLMDQIKEKGYMTVAMEGTYAPWTYHDENDVLTGFDVDVANEIAKRLDVDVQFVEGPWDGLLAGVEVGRYDVLINCVGVTEERKLKYDYSDPYAYNKPVVIVRGDYDEIHSFEDLKGKTTANTITSTFAEEAEKWGAKVTGVDDLTQTIELVLSGRFDATLNTEMTYLDYMKAHPDANLKIAAYGDNATLIAIPVRKGPESASFLNAINEALADMAEKGVLSELSLKYFDADITKE
ncbi:MAG: transporter substrate-binding domain-containing protein [Anaerolineaceae bacterium]|nr:transporter substrate-binding domain-containing protein [Anaerolineaceae bacterium]